MHESISIHTTCLPDGGWATYDAAWRDLGARRVSFISSQLDDDLASGLDVLVAESRQVETITHQFLFGRQLDQDPDEWLEAERDRLAQVVDVAASLRARSIYMVTGGHGTLTWEDAAERFSAAIQPCITRARALGVELLVEPANPVYADLTILHSLRDSVTLAEMAGIGVCLDVFASWSEAGLRDTIERAMPRIHLVQVGDYVLGDRSVPARAVPGDGVIPLRRILEWLVDRGYDGAYDLELLGPRIDAEGRVAATRRAAEHLGELLTSLGV